MDELVVPYLLAGVGIDTNERIREKVIAMPFATVEIAGGVLDGQIYVTACGVG